MKKLIIFVVLVIIILLGVYVIYPGPENSDQNVQNVETTFHDEEENLVYQIDKNESNVQFEIDEILRGENFRVVGVTDQVEAQVSINEEDVSSLEISDVAIIAETLKTDSSSRDNAIKNFVLKSDQPENRLIALKEISVEGLPQIPVSDLDGEINFKINGDLFISGVNRRVWFDAKISELTPQKIILSVEGQIMRFDFNLSIPSVPFVASVDQEIFLSADLVLDPVPR